MKTLEDFRAARKLSLNLNVDLGYNAFEKPTAGFIYAGYYISLNDDGCFYTEAECHEEQHPTLAGAEQWLWDEWVEGEEA